MLSTTTVFEVIENDDDIWRRAVQLRENTSVDQRAMYRSPFQRICEIISYKRRHEAVNGKLSSQGLAKLYKEKGRVSEDEKLTDTYIDGALVVWNRALCQDNVMKIILEAEKLPPAENPFSKMHNLTAIVQRARTHGCECLGVGGD